MRSEGGRTDAHHSATQEPCANPGSPGCRTFSPSQKAGRRIWVFRQSPHSLHYYQQAPRPRSWRIVAKNERKCQRLTSNKPPPRTARSRPFRPLRRRCRTRCCGLCQYAFLVGLMSMSGNGVRWGKQGEEYRMINGIKMGCCMRIQSTEIREESSQHATHLIAQNGIGTRTQLSPAPAICAMSCSVCGRNSSISSYASASASRTEEGRPREERRKE